MRTLIIALALSTTALASPAAAQSQGPYVGVEGGVMIMQDPKFDYSDADVDIRNAYDVDLRAGRDIDIIVGYDVGMFRVEGELGWKRTSVRDVDVDPLIDEFFVGVPYEAEGNMSALSAMLNGLIDIGDERASGYFGGGIGRARVRNRFQIDEINRGFSGTDSGFAWQVIAGVRLAVTDNVDVGLKYRHFRVPNLGYRWGADVTDGPFRLDGDWKSNSFLASLIFNFRAPPPPPVIVDVAPPPPPPPAPATQVCPDGSVILATEMCPAPPPPPPPAPAPERG